MKRYPRTSNNPGDDLFVDVNGQPSGLTFEQTLDQNEHEGGVDVGEIEAERRNREDYGGEEE